MNLRTCDESVRDIDILLQVTRLEETESSSALQFDETENCEPLSREKMGLGNARCESAVRRRGCTKSVARWKQVSKLLAFLINGSPRKCLFIQSSRTCQDRIQIERVQRS